jgi:hypothetical protein
MSPIAEIDLDPDRPARSVPDAGAATLVVLDRGDSDDALLARVTRDAAVPGWAVLRARPPRAAAAAVALDLGDADDVPAGPEPWRLRVGPLSLAAALSGRFALCSVWHRRPFAVSVRLERGRADRGGVETIARATIGTTGGLADLRERVVATAARLVRQCLADPAGVAIADAGDAAAPVQPRADGVAAFVGGWLRWRAARWRARLCQEWWTVGVCAQPIQAVLSQGRLGPVDWLRPRPGATFWADPFAWPGTDRILCEECPAGDAHDAGAGVGVIAALRPTPGGGWERDTVLLGGALHRSYPCVHAEGGETYLVPECLGAGAVSVLRLDPMGRTEVVATVTDRPLADPTLFRHGGRAWLAGTDVAIGEHDNLCLFHADAVAGPWHPHRRNPVKLDIRSSRPAGTPFEHDGRLFRPAQDCAGSYGAAIVINEVTSLTPDRFSERPVARLTPEPRGPLPDGLHTLSAAGPRTLVDGKRLVWRPGRALRRGARRLLRGATGAATTAVSRAATMTRDVTRDPGSRRVRPAAPGWSP